MQGQVSGITDHLGNRLRQWRKSVPLKSYELARLIHISQGSLSDIENNKSLPSAETIAKMHLNTNISVIWLLTGEGAMRKGSEHAQELESPMAYEEMSEYGKDQNLKEYIEKLVRLYHKGDPQKRAHLLGFLTGADPGDDRAV